MIIFVTMIMHLNSIYEWLTDILLYDSDNASISMSGFINLHVYNLYYKQRTYV